ncbi:MAG: Spy/CpxP family protein refolding chaperone [Acidobacteriales bacterium]|nr:Spy/CpxP family protein refolding chaperone [Terriglobales bacterium]
MKARRIRILAVTAAVVLAVAAALAQGMHPGGGPMGGDFPFGGHMLGYFSDVLDLTQAQQDQVKAILEKEKPTIHPLMQQLMQFHQDMSKLEDSGTFDEAKVRALAAQNTQTMTELIVQKARIQAELMQVLTADQKTKLQQLRAKHEARMKEHMQNHPPDPTSD